MKKWMIRTMALTLVSCMIVPLAIFSAFAEERSSDAETEKIKKYCAYYGIEYTDTEEFRKEVLGMIEQRGFSENDGKVRKKTSSDRFSLKNRKAVAAWALKQVGKPYDYVFSENKVNDVEGNLMFNCSELVWKAWRYNLKVAVDLDSNGGTGVYPNNIRDSKRTVKIAKG